MFSILRITLFFLLAINYCNAQVLPRENSKLHYRIIGFTFPPAKNNAYTIELADGFYEDSVGFNNNILKTILSDTNRVIMEVPYFDRVYTWRVKHGKDGSGKNTFYHFSTLTNEYVDQCLHRINITSPAESYKDAFVFFDSHCALYNMEGKPVWFLPNNDGKKRSTPRDLKLTPFGTITYMKGGNIYEIDYDGNILWQGPANGAHTEADMRYHHEFTRLKNGNYMVLTNESMWAKIMPPGDSLVFVPPANIIDTSDISYKRVLLGSIVEYNKTGSIVWAWKSSEFFNSSKYTYRGSISDLMNIHENAFYFDEKNNNVYLSFKGISSIIRIKYPLGTADRAYGKLTLKNMPNNSNTLFCDQHACAVSQKGLLYLYNNNVCNPGKPSEVLKMREPISLYDTLQVVWKYECSVDNINSTEAANLRFTSGGNAIDLPGNALLVYMGVPYSKTFILNENKKIIWSAMPEKWNKRENNWTIFPNYRASIITDKKQLENLIWNTK